MRSSETDLRLNSFLITEKKVSLFASFSAAFSGEYNKNEVFRFKRWIYRINPDKSIINVSNMYDVCVVCGKFYLICLLLIPVISFFAVQQSAATAAIPDIVHIGSVEYFTVLFCSFIFILMMTLFRRPVASNNRINHVYCNFCNKWLLLFLNRKYGIVNKCFSYWNDSSVLGNNLFFRMKRQCQAKKCSPDWNCYTLLKNEMIHKTIQALW